MQTLIATPKSVVRRRLGNIGDYEYATHTPQPPHKGLDWEQRDDEEVCGHCFLLRIKNSDVCVDNGQCGRSC